MKDTDSSGLHVPLYRTTSETNPTKLTDAEADEPTSFKCRYLQNNGEILRNRPQINVFSPQLTQQGVPDKIEEVLSD
jgi:hypothetical protein